MQVGGEGRVFVFMVCDMCCEKYEIRSTGTTSATSLCSCIRMMIPVTRQLHKLPARLVSISEMHRPAAPKG